jgi:hypothetical protein
MRTIHPARINPRATTGHTTISADHERPVPLIRGEAAGELTSASEDAGARDAPVDGEGRTTVASVTAAVGRRDGFTSLPLDVALRWHSRCL